MTDTDRRGDSRLTNASNDRRIVITQDGKGKPLVLTVYQGADRLAVVHMDDRHAVALAADLLALVRTFCIPLTEMQP